MNRQIKKRIVLKKKVKTLINKTLILLIIFLILLIGIKKDESLKEKITKEIFTKNIKFTKLRLLYEKYLGNINFINNNLYETKPVFTEKIQYLDKKEIENGIKLKVPNKYLIPALESGIVTYIGSNDKHESTIVIEQIDGTETHYSNVKILNVRLYDYIEKGKLFAETINDEIFLYFEKNGEFVNYKKYI